VSTSDLGSPGWNLYFDCRDGVNQALARAIAAGATLVLAHTTIGEHGYIAIVDDPEGNRIGLHAMTA
jgi:predicted enzyme related to lactoylglutathione lyase